MDEKALEQRITDIETNLAEMRDWVDRELSQLKNANKESGRVIVGKLDSTTRALGDIKSVVFGNTNFGLTGVLDRLGKIEVALGKVVEAREAQKNQLAGIQTGLKVVQYLLGILGTGGLGAIIASLAGIAEW